MPLRRVLLLLVLGVFGLATAVFTATLLWVVERADQQTRLAHAEAHHVILRAQIDRHFESLELLHRYFTRNDALRDALLQGHDPVFALDPLFNQLAGLEAISRLSLQLPDLGRIYDSDPGATLSSALQRTALSGRPERALLWREQRLEVVVTLPLFERGRVLAVVGLARPFDLEAMARDDVGRRLTLRLRESSGPPQTDATESPAIEIALEEADGALWRIDRIPLDVEGAADGRLWVEFRQEATAEVREQRGMIVAVLLLLAAIGGANLVLLILAGRSVFSALDRAIDGLERAGRGETVTHQPARLRIVETERLERAAEQMAENLRQRAMAEAEAGMAFEDPVTGLGNRRALKRMLRARVDADRLAGRSSALADSQAGRSIAGHIDGTVASGPMAHDGMALVLLDIDHFKTVNDLHGHTFGDRLLRKLADRLKASVESPTQVFHLGSDELVVALEGFRIRDGLICDRQGELLQSRVQRLLDAVQAVPFEVDGVELPLSVTAGATLHPDPADALLDPLQRLDLALARAKRDARGRVRLYEPRLREELIERDAIERLLRRALDQDALGVCIQGQVDADLDWTGGEVLVRLPDGLGGWVSPQRFIPVAESTGLIHDLSLYVLDRAFEVLADWARDPRRSDWTLSVNVSALVLPTEGFAAALERGFKTHGIAPGRLMLEITEAVVVQLSERTLKQMHQFRDWGVRWSIDDFGTGYSSLAYLRRMPLHELKIDRTFVKDLPRDANDLAIVRATISLAHELGLVVIAEGIENEAQLDALRAEGCDGFQGFYFSKPVSRDAFEALTAVAPASSA